MNQPGWYPDPGNASLLRLWDGTAWTAQTRPVADVQQPAAHRGRGRVAIAVAMVVAVALVAVGAAVAITRQSGPTIEVTLESVVDVGPLPFTPSVADPVDPVTGASPGERPDTATAVPANQPGLFGGSGDLAVCDTGALITYLDDAPDKAAAFASVLGLSPRDISTYVDGLTPVVSRFDTLVTNHGFDNGVAVPRQSVLQAGTAMLVDEFGVPRVRCACGNPLAAPASPAATPTYTGTPWDGFDSTQLLIVAASDQPITNLEVIDIATGEPGQVLVGTGGLVLNADGLGVVTIGDPTEEVIATLTSVLGEPTAVEEDMYSGGKFLQVSWRSLTTVFQVPRGDGGDDPSRFGFQGYVFGPWTISPSGDPVWWVAARGDNGQWDPVRWERNLSTESGIRIGTDAATANATYPDTYISRYQTEDENFGLNTSCSVIEPNVGLEPDPDIPIQWQQITLDRSRDGLFFAPIQNNQVRGIGAGILCYT